jgi:hypothetical protein
MRKVQDVAHVTCLPERLQGAIPSRHIGRVKEVVNVTIFIDKLVKGAASVPNVPDAVVEDVLRRWKVPEDVRPLLRDYVTWRILCNTPVDVRYHRREFDRIEMFSSIHFEPQHFSSGSFSPTYLRMPASNPPPPPHPNAFAFCVQVVV